MKISSNATAAAILLTMIGAGVHAGIQDARKEAEDRAFAFLSSPAAADRDALKGAASGHGLDLVIDLPEGAVFRPHADEQTPTASGGGFSCHQPPPARFDDRAHEMFGFYKACEDARVMIAAPSNPSQFVVFRNLVKDMAVMPGTGRLVTSNGTALCRIVAGKALPLGGQTVADFMKRKPVCAAYAQFRIPK